MEINSYLYSSLLLPNHAPIEMSQKEKLTNHHKKKGA